MTNDTWQIYTGIQKRKENPNYHIASRTRIYNYIYPIISIHLASTSIHATDTQSTNLFIYIYICTFFPFSFSIVTRVKHDRVESDLERKQGRIKSSIFIQSNGTDRITDLRIGFCINRKRYRISSPIKINNHRARVSAR